jgi:hypothetical protein
MKCTELPHGVHFRNVTKKKSCALCPQHPNTVSMKKQCEHAAIHVLRLVLEEVTLISVDIVVSLAGSRRAACRRWAWRWE